MRSKIYVKKTFQSTKIQGTSRDSHFATNKDWVIVLQLQYTHAAQTTRFHLLYLNMDMFTSFLFSQL